MSSTDHAEPPSRRHEIEWALLCAALVILGCSIGFWLHKEHSDIDRNERARLQGAAQVIDDNLVHQLKGMNHALDGALKEFPPASLAKSPAEAVRHLKALTAAMPGVRSMFMLDRSGRLLAATWDKFVVLQDFSHREYFTTPRVNAQADAMFVSTPFRNIADVYSLNVSRVAVSPDGAFAGVVTATLDPDYFNDALRSVLYAPDMMAALVHEDGKVFVAQPEESQLLGKNLSMPGSSFVEHRQESQIATMKYGLLYSTGEKQLRAFRTVRSADVPMDKPLVVVIGRSTSAIFAAWKREAWINGAFFVLFSAGLGVSLLLSQRRRRALIEANRETRVALATSEGLYRSLFDNMLNGLAYCRMIYQDGRPVDFVYVSVNKSFEVQTGLKGVEGRKATEVIPGIRQSDPGLFEIYGRVAATGQHEKFETYVSALNMWFEVSVYRPVSDHFLAIFDVITERKLAEAALKESEQRLAMAMEATSDGLWDWNIASGRAYFSPAYYRMLGYEAEEFAGIADSWLERIHPDDRERALAANQDCIDNRVESFAVEFRMRAKDGTWRWVLGRGRAAERSASGKALSMIGTHVDITERKLAEASLKAREERFQALFDGASDGIMTLTPEGKLIAVNAAFAKMHGYSVAEMQEMNLRDLDPAEVQQLMPERMRRILSGETIAFEVEHYHKDGRLFPLEVSASLLSSGTERIIQAFHRDITERKRQERRSKAQHALLHRQKEELEQTLERVKRLEGLISICMYCKKIRTETNAWQKFEQYIGEHSDATFSHGVCPECFQKQTNSLDSQ